MEHWSRLTFTNLFCDLISKSLEPAGTRISTFDLPTLLLCYFASFVDVCVRSPDTADQAAATSNQRFHSFSFQPRMGNLLAFACGFLRVFG